MRTRVVPTDEVEAIVDTLLADELVALPTETVYGLAARAGSREAVERIFRVKGRPADNPLIVHTADAEEAFALSRSVPEAARRLAESFWPGPLTLVLHSAVDWPWVQAGLDTIAVRVPEPEYLRGVLRRAGPLAAPSANLSGRPSPTTADHCLTDLGGRIPLIVDGGPCPGGMESTVVDCTGVEPRVLRPGPLTAEAIRELTGGTSRKEDLPGGGSPGPGHGPARSSVRSPGTRYPHYRPRARVVLVEDGSAVRCEDCMVIAPGVGSAGHPRRYDSLEELARKLYGWLREADVLGTPVVYVQRVPEEGLGVAIMNRLKKAADEDG